MCNAVYAENVYYIASYGKVPDVGNHRLAFVSRHRQFVGKCLRRYDVFLFYANGKLLDKTSCREKLQQRIR